MKVKISALALALSAAFSGSAFAAAIDLDSASPVAFTYMAEQTVSGSGTVISDGATVANLDASVLLGASFADDAWGYVRFDMTGATFTGSSALAFAINDSAAAAAATNVSQGGTNGTSFVIFGVAPTSTNNLVGANTGTFNVDELKVTNQNGVSLRYRLYETLTNAANETLPLKDVTVNNYVTFGATLTSTATATATTPTANVSAASGPFKEFDAATALSTSLANLGSIDVTLAASALLQSGTGAVIADVITDTNTVSVTGDFGFAQNDNGTYTGVALNRVFLDDAANCGSANYNAATLSATAATFTGVTAAGIAGTLYLCAQAEGTPAIATSTYAGTVNLVPQTNFSAADFDFEFEIDRNGASTYALNLPNPTATDQAFVRINNIGSSSGRVFGTMYDQTGAVIGTASTVLSTSLGEKATLVLSVPQIAELIGATTWTGRTKLEIVAEIPSADLRVQSLMRTAEGSLFNMSTNTTNN